MSQSRHDSMVNEFVEYLKKEGFTNYNVEFPIEINSHTAFCDVVIPIWDKMFLFDMKSNTSNFSRDIQQIKSYIVALRKNKKHDWKSIEGFIVYDKPIKEKVVNFRNLFKNIEILILDGGKVFDLDKVELKGLIKKRIGKFYKLRTILKILGSEGSNLFYQ